MSERKVEAFSLEACGISKRYGGVAALSAVDLAVRPGDVHGLLGANGAGKTTLLRVLLRLAARDAGTVRVFGTDLDSRSALLDSVAGFVEAPAFYPYLSGRANLALLDRLDGGAVSTRGSRVGAVLERLTLDAHADGLVGRYSAGMRQRLGLAAALLRRPRLLLIDEPTSAIDPVGARGVRAVLRELASDGAAIVFSSHDLDSVEEVCGTISVLDTGRLIFSGTIGDLRGRVPPAHILRTSDNARALSAAAQRHDVRVETGERDSLLVFGQEQALDAYVLALAAQQIAVRHLEPRAHSLRSLMFDAAS
jgi:ABC-2 type transport system ATP-binding protein